MKGGGSFLTLRCRCGAVQGRVGPVGAWTVNRVVCYCADCQAFARHLGRADLLDAKGGSDIAQVPPASMTIEKGRENLAMLRLREGGLYRCHSTCCATPIGNTPGPAIPVIGLIAANLRAADGGAPDAILGAPSGGVHGARAIGGAPPGTKGISARLLARTMARVLYWLASGRKWPHPYFERATGAPSLPVRVLSKDECVAAYAPG
jgi:hypothetical protein